MFIGHRDKALCAAIHLTSTLRNRYHLKKKKFSRWENWTVDGLEKNSLSLTTKWLAWDPVANLASSRLRSFASMFRHHHGPMLHTHVFRLTHCCAELHGNHRLHGDLKFRRDSTQPRCFLTLRVKLRTVAYLNRRGHWGCLNFGNACSIHLFPEKV